MHALWRFVGSHADPSASAAVQLGCENSGEWTLPSPHVCTRGMRPLPSRPQWLKQILRARTDAYTYYYDRGLFYHEIVPGLICGTMPRNVSDLDYLHFAEDVNVVLNVSRASRANTTHLTLLDIHQESPATMTTRLTLSWCASLAAAAE